MIEYSITIKGDNTSITHRDTRDAALLMCRDNRELKSAVQELYERFKRESGEDEPEVTIDVKAKMIW